MPYSRHQLSASVDGAPIVVVATATPGTTIHTAESGDQAIDEPQLNATNVTNASVTLTVAWGGVTDPGNLILKNYVLAAYSAQVPITSGQLLQNAKAVAAWCSVASAVNISGGVIRTM